MDLKGALTLEREFRVQSAEFRFILITNSGCRFLILYIVCTLYSALCTLFLALYSLSSVKVSI